MTPTDAVIDTIIASWEAWEAEAGQQAQQDQDHEAYTDVMREHLRRALAPLSRPVAPQHATQTAPLVNTLAALLALAMLGWKKSLGTTLSAIEGWLEAEGAERERCARIAEEPEPVPECHCRFECECGALAPMDPQELGKRIAARIREG